MKENRTFFLFPLALLLFLSSCGHHRVVYQPESRRPLVQQMESRRLQQPESRRPPPPSHSLPSVSVIPKSAEVTLPPPKKREVIVLDAGHGGKDMGTKSSRYHYIEKELTLHTAEMVKGYLESLGYPVIMTREKDTFLSLSERSELANTTAANLFVSIHYNSAPNPEAEGIEVYYYKDEKNPKSARILESKLLGEEVLHAIIFHTRASSRGVRKADLAVVREAKMPAILIEGGFLTNPKERDKIKNEEYLHYYAWGIAKGIDHFITKK